MLPITSLVAATAAIALIPLSISVSFQRMKAGVAVGFGDDAALMRRIRGALRRYCCGPSPGFWSPAGAFTSSAS